MTSSTGPGSTVEAAAGLVRDLGGLGVAAGPAETLAGELLGRWAEPHRHYHDARHLGEVLSALRELQRHSPLGARDALVARLAAWFHDAVYDVRGTRGDTGEAASADLAAHALREVGAPVGLVDAVCRLVLGTVDHEMAGTPVSAAFHDADLWILASPRDRFDDYCAAVRREYAHVPDAAYASGRSAVLQPFLARDTIYLTAHARAEWEPRARGNLARELTRLSRA